MKADALDKLKTAFVDAYGNRQFRPDAEPRHVYFTIEQDGSLMKRTADRRPFNHTSNDFDSLAERVQRVAEVGGVTSIWYTIAGVVGILDGDFRDKITMALTISEPMKKLMEWDKTPYKEDHKTTWNLFRRFFRNYTPKHEGLLGAIAKVKANTGAEVNSNMSRQKVSMDKSMVAEASGLESLPEVLEFQVPFFAEAVCDVQVRVQVVFDFDPETAKFNCYVLPGQITEAVFAAESYLHDSIGKAMMRQAMPGAAVPDDGKNLRSKTPIYSGLPFAVKE